MMEIIEWGSISNNTMFGISPLSCQDCYEPKMETVDQQLWDQQIGVEGWVSMTLRRPGLIHGWIKNIKSSEEFHPTQQCGYWCRPKNSGFDLTSIFFWNTLKLPNQFRAWIRIDVPWWAHQRAGVVDHSDIQSHPRYLGWFSGKSWYLPSPKKNHEPPAPQLIKHSDFWSPIYRGFFSTKGSIYRWFSASQAWLAGTYFNLTVNI